MGRDYDVGPSIDSHTWLRITTAVCAGVLLAVLLCVVLYRIRLVFVPFVAGFVVAYLLDPLLDKLEARGWSRVRAVWAVMAAFIGLLGLALVLLVPRVLDQIGDAWENRRIYGLRADQYYRRSRESLERFLSQYLPQAEASQYIDTQLAQLEKWADAHKGKVITWIGARIAQAAGLLALILLGALIAFHFMLVIDPLKQATQRLFLSPRQSREMDELVARVNRMLGAYVRGMAAVSVLVAAATALALWGAGFYFGTRYALLIGVLAGVTYAVPWVGQATSAVAAFFFGLVTADHHALAAALVCAVLVISINQLADNVLMPRIVGEQVGLHPLAVLFALMAGFQLFGLVGMIVAVPLAASLRIAVRRWIPLLPDDEDRPRGLPRIDAARVVEGLGRVLQWFATPLAGAAHREMREGEHTGAGDG